VRPDELRDKTDEELRQVLVDRTEDLLHFRMQRATGVVDNVRLARTARREIARVKTLQKERQRSEGMSERGQLKERVGVVVSDKMDKTITVAVERLRAHKLYKKTQRRTSKFHAHDELNTCNVGDVVRIRESRPLSKLKRWKMIEVVKRAD